MSWSLDIYSPQPHRIAIDDLVAKLLPSVPALEVSVRSTELLANGQEVWQSLVLSEHSEPKVTITVAPFEEECDADPELIFMLEREITDSDADDGDLDEKYTSQLKHLLRTSCWHYQVSVAQNDQIDQENFAVRTAYSISQISDGLMHDLQSGAWMDYDMFDSLLDAYYAPTQRAAGL